ncbi:MAG TPA: DUF6569 family protein [Candidatus Sulfotelmatobacter sp.]|nr:DUF6569 family protein [Candidatus Sulfotelmatobacter sp.]
MLQTIRPRFFVAVAVVVAVAGMLLPNPRPVRAGEQPLPSGGYKVLDPIRHGSLTIFPVVAPKSYATGDFLTLDEGLRSGDVVVTEYGSVPGLLRRHGMPAVQRNGAEVNRLVLVNNSKRPLLLLAGEIVTGGKQDRVIGKDRIVPPESDPVDLSVFCVEPGRWVATSDRFGTSGKTYGSTVEGGPPAGTMMAQPSVRAKAMGEKDQNQVWAEVRKQQSSIASELAASAPQASTDEIRSTSSYAHVMENKDVKEKIDEVAKPIEQNYQSLIKQLRDRKAVGVVVAVDGRIIWSDVFASTELLEKYWPKLVRSYASEAVVSRAKGGEASRGQAETFLANMDGRKEMIENEPGIYRHTEVNGDGFKAFALMSLLPKTGFDVHVAKMAD